MLTSSARRRVCVVLVGARNPQNIGAAARAMQDFGFSELRVVNSFAPPFEAAQLEASSAVGAGDVMRSARLFTDLSEAIADCHVTVGTTAIGDRHLEQHVLTLQQAAPLLRKNMEVLPQSASAGNTHVTLGDDLSGRTELPRIALLFGSEKTGLTREQLSFCSMLLTVPLWQPEGRHLSMNLGQAVAVCLYELTREGSEGLRDLPSSDAAPATAADRERLVDLLLQNMHHSGYARRFPANARPEIVRRLAHSLGSSSVEAATWMGFLKVVLRRMTGPEEPVV